jgi:hypothetical protein
MGFSNSLFSHKPHVVFIEICGMCYILSNHVRKGLYLASMGFLFKKVRILDSPSAFFFFV